MTEFICGFAIKPEVIPKLTTKSVFEKNLSKNDSEKGAAYLVGRVR